MVKFTLAITILIFYAIRFRPSVIKRVERKNINIRLFAGDILMLILAILQLSDFDIKFISHEYISYLGLVISLIGGIIASIARLTLNKNYVPAGAAFASKNLTKKGIYKIIRHPSYLGTLLAFFGFELAMNSYFIVIFFFFVVVIIKQINKEEKMLAKSHDADWQAFKKNTPYKLVPFIY